MCLQVPVSASSCHVFFAINVTVSVVRTDKWSTLLAIVSVPMGTCLGYK